MPPICREEAPKTAPPDPMNPPVEPSREDDDAVACPIPKGLVDAGCPNGLAAAVLKAPIPVFTGCCSWAENAPPPPKLDAPPPRSPGLLPPMPIPPVKPERELPAGDAPKGLEPKGAVLGLVAAAAPNGLPLPAPVVPHAPPPPPPTSPDKLFVIVELDGNADLLPPNNPDGD